MRAGRVAALLGMTAALLAALGAAGCTPYNYVVHGPSVSAGVAAEIACAGVFVSHRTLDDVVKNDVDRLSPLTAMNSYHLDRAGQSLSVTALHLITRTAVYRPGIGWSASKSVTATLIGTLVAAGKLGLDAPAPVPEWQGQADPRRAITLSQLLHMSSGLEFHEPYDPGSDSTKMLFERGNMAAYAASRPLIHKPGTVWSYSSGTANILSRLVFRAAGGTLKNMEAYARQHLFAPAGMTSAVFEPDESGNFVGSSYLYMTARDWARFGLLYLNGGTIDGVRIVPPSWTLFVRTPAPADPDKGYGGQFWLNGRKEPGGTARQFPHLPADMFSAEGHNDEFVAIIPSRHVVIVRLGWTVVENAFNRDKHFAAILAALPKP